MGKPQIIGYKTDPNAAVWQLIGAEQWSISFDSLNGEQLVMNRWPYTVQPITDDNRTAIMRYIGMRPIYRERDFKATLYNNLEGCSLWCRKCGYRWSTHRLPHDSAGLHQRIIHGTS
jgi:hypothetical protein